MKDEKKQPWDRQRDGEGKLEPSLWHSRFTAFRLAGAGRSLLGCVNAERVKKGQKRSNYIPGSWRRASEKWQWRKRAEAWDKAERQRAQAEYEAERLEWRERRRRLLQGFFAKLAQALDRFDPSDVSLGSLTPAMKAAVQELRAEFDDEPTAKHEVALGLDESTRQFLGKLVALVLPYIPEDKLPEFKERLAGLEESDA